MKTWLPVVTATFALVGCSPPHQFEISSDEPIKSVELDLANMRKFEVQLISEHHAVARAYTADSSGEIRVLLSNGATVKCRVGYITNGEAEPHQFIIRQRRCNAI